MNEFIAQEPLWLQLWIQWMVVANLGGVAFIIGSRDVQWHLRPEPAVVVVTMVANVLFMGWLFEQVGYVRLLGLSHVIFWTPLLIWLWRRRQGIVGRVLPGYLWTVGLTNTVSLVIDYVDVARYLAGDAAST